MFSASASNSTIVTISLSYAVVAYSNIFGI